MISATTSRATRFWTKMLIRISPHVRKLERMSLDDLAPLNLVPQRLIIDIVDQRESFFEFVPNDNDAYYVNVGWQQGGREQPRDPASAINLVARKAGQVFSCAVFFPSSVRQTIIDDVDKWDADALAAEERKTP